MCHHFKGFRKKSYWLSDLFMKNFPDLGKKLYLGSIKQADSLYSYLYFSVITQTTIGFGGILPDGGNIVDTKSNLIKFFSLLQMLSVIYMTGWSLK